MPELIAGKTYTVTITVRNGSSRDGSSVDARLTTGVQAFVSDLDVIPLDFRSDDYAADQTKTFTYAMPIAENMVNYLGQLQAVVKSPSGNIIANTVYDFSIVEPPPPPVELLYCDVIIAGNKVRVFEDSPYYHYYCG